MGIRSRAWGLDVWLEVVLGVGLGRRLRLEWGNKWGVGFGWAECSR